MTCHDVPKRFRNYVEEIERNCNYQASVIKKKNEAIQAQEERIADLEATVKVLQYIIEKNLVNGKLEPVTPEDLNQ